MYLYLWYKSKNMKKKISKNFQFGVAKENRVFILKPWLVAQFSDRAP